MSKRSPRNTKPPSERKPPRKNAPPQVAFQRGGFSWSSLHSYLLLATLTLACLLPFSGRAFAFDDPLFIWAAKHIVQHPFDPYGFQVNWYGDEMSMSEVTKNPPLDSYYAAGIGAMTHWSERALHLAFLLPALLAVLGTYRLAGRFTRHPLLAALVLLLSPAFLVSATSVMCDVPMLAFWVWAAILWTEGCQSERAPFLITSAILMGACALTKYFGAALIPLLLAYSLARKCRAGIWALYFLIPVGVILGYQLCTLSLYSRGLFSDAASYATDAHGEGLSIFAKTLIGLAFAGGCAAPVLFFSPLLWRWKTLLGFATLGATMGLLVANDWIALGFAAAHTHWTLISAQLGLWVACGLSIVALAAYDTWKRRNSDSMFLALWVAGTVIFAFYVNWTVNARSILPMIPAVGILLARRLEQKRFALLNWKQAASLALPLPLAATMSAWIVSGDTALADSARTAVELIHGKTQETTGTLSFQGHWGFQYYMESLGATVSDVYRPGDVAAIPENNTNVSGIPKSAPVSAELFDLTAGKWVTTMQPQAGAGFYSSLWGPLPFTFGPIPPERYEIARFFLRRSLPDSQIQH